mgnify:FL=1
MFNIAEYLQKFAYMEGDFAFQKEVITKALKEICNLENVDFEMRKGTLYLKTNPLVKSIVFMKKDQIIEYIGKNFPKKMISDVR